MESARFVLAIVLMVAVIFLTNLLFPTAQQPPRSAVTDSLAAPPAAAAPAAAEPGTVESGTAGPAAVDTQPATPVFQPAPSAAAPLASLPIDTVFVESPLYRFGFSTRGGALVVSQMKEFESFVREGEPVNMVPIESEGLLRHDLRVGDRVIPLSNVDFRMEPAGGLTVGASDTAATLRLVGTDAASGATLIFEYRFDGATYGVQVSGRVAGVSGAGRNVLLRTGPALAVHEANAEEDLRALSYSFNSQREGIESVALQKVDEQRVEEGPLTWVALKNKYFLLAAVAQRTDEVPGFGGLIAAPLEQAHAAALTATLPIRRDDTFAYALYIGPQQHDRLQAMGHQLEDVNPYGWRWLRPVVRPVGHLIIRVVEYFHNAFTMSYGAVLILMGVLVQILMWPLQARAARAQMKNMELQPRIKEIQTRYKNNPEQLQKEMVRLYKEEGFNPFGGCLPMLLPWPVLITLFFVFQSTILFRGVEFLWLPDLARHDPLYILPVLLAVSMFAMQWLMMRTTPEINPQMKMMMWIMPVMMLVIFLKLASGLNLYYFSSQVASLPRQLMLNRERRRFREAKEAKEKAAVPTKPAKARK